MMGLFDPRARVLCALAFSIALSSLRAFSLPAALIPLLLLPCGPLPPMGRALSRLNAAGLVMALLLALTYPGEALWGPFSREGVKMGVLLAVRLNLVSIVLLRMIVSMGPERIEAALSALGLSEKLRVLLLLTLRGVHLLTERTQAAMTAARLRAPRLRWEGRTFACVLGSSLLQSADRSERMTTALRLRGGLAGFSQTPPLAWRWQDTALCLFFALNIAAILA